MLRPRTRKHNVSAKVCAPYAWNGSAPNQLLSYDVATNSTGPVSGTGAQIAPALSVAHNLGAKVHRRKVSYPAYYAASQPSEVRTLPRRAAKQRAKKKINGVLQAHLIKLVACLHLV